MHGIPAFLVGHKLPVSRRPNTAISLHLTGPRKPSFDPSAVAKDIE
jgi:hypothetical protein